MFFCKSLRFILFSRGEKMKISYENSSGSLMIRLIGDVDDNGIIKARQDIDRLLEKERYYEVVFDFSGVSFMDSTGIGMLLGRYKKLEKLSVPMYVTGTNKQVDKVFFTSGIYEIICKLA